MIDLQILRTDPERIRESQRRRGENVDLVADLVAADVARRAAQQEFEDLRGRQNALSKAIGPLQGALKTAADAAAKTRAGAQVDALMVEAGVLADQVKTAEATFNAASEAADLLILQLSNLVNLDSPVGGEADFKILEQVGTPRDFAAEGFEPKDHLDIGELLGAIDTGRGASLRRPLLLSRRGRRAVGVCPTQPRHGAGDG